METLTIERRFRGPPRSGNGGYVCGRLARLIEGPVVVRLHVPPPLETAMEIRREGKRIELVHGALVVASARPASLDLDPPAAPSWTDAEAASRNYAGFRFHPFPGCFVCGPERAPGDGLRIFAGPCPAVGCVAAPWIPDDSLGDGTGRVRPEFIWAALDCPGAFSFSTSEGGAMVLGELAASVRGSVAVGEPCVVVGWEISRDGRRHYTGTALFGRSGECSGVARGVWFEI